MDHPPNLLEIVSEVAASGRSQISLDELAEMVIGDRAIGYGELEALIDLLEESGIEVADSSATSPAQKVLATVFTTAHALRDKLGRAPTIDEIAEATGLGRSLVEGAIAHARRVSTVGEPEPNAP